MMLGLVLLPLLAGLAALAIRARRLRELLLLGTALLHVALVAAAALTRPAAAEGAWLTLDDLGVLFLLVTSVLFLAVSFYAVGYLRREPEQQTDPEEGFLFSNEPEPTFVACLLLFLASMTLVTLSRHLGLLWVGIEATTLASAPLVYFHRQHRSLEATWRYLIVCSVGIALALLGNLLIAGAAGPAGSLGLDDLLARAPGLRREWLEAGFLLVLVGYGTKMGLAPMHGWLPDAHGESPSLVSALLSGALLNCAFLGILRVRQVLTAAGDSEFAAGPLVAFGLLSMGLAALLILRQPDYKRLLAYSSVEHMGVLSFGVGVGGVAAFGAMLHAVVHSLTKAALFLVAGNLLGAYATKRMAAVRGARAVVPASAALWVAGILALSGVPPFGIFLSELTILRGAAAHDLVPAALFLLFLGIAFAGVSAQALPMALGGDAGGRPRMREPVTRILPPLLLLAFALLLGAWLPAPLVRLVEGAARLAGGG